MTEMLDQRGENMEGVQTSKYLNMFVGCISLVITLLNSLTVTISELINFHILAILNELMHFQYCFMKGIRKPPVERPVLGIQIHSWGIF